jgi:hypothetical protein
MSDFLTFVSGAFVDKALSVANQWAQIGQINGSGDYANIALNFSNISATENDTISIAISNNSTSPNTDDIIESNIPMPVGAVLSRENIITDVGEYVYILATTSNIACRLSGITQNLQSIFGFGSDILALSSDIEYLSAVIDSDDNTLQAEINALTNNLNSDIASLSAAFGTNLNNAQNTLQSEINALSADLYGSSGSLQNQINALGGQLSGNSGSLQNQINALSSSLNSDNANLQNQINSLSNKTSGLFGSINNVTGSRSFGATYTNNTGKPMFVSVTAGLTGNYPYYYDYVNSYNDWINYASLQGIVDGTKVTQNISSLYYDYGFYNYDYWYDWYTNIPVSINFIVPAGAQYQVTGSSSVYTLSNWIETY